MNIFIFILGIAVGAGAVWFFIRRKIKEVERELKRTEHEKEEKIEQIGAFGRNVEYRLKV